MLAAALALLLAGNGIAMLTAGSWWYGAVPGVTMTGPYNAHFVKDIGAAYLVLGGSFAWTAARPTSRLAWGAAGASTAFLVFHALIHLADAGAGDHPIRDLTRDFAGVFLPPIVAGALLFATRPIHKEV